MSVSKQVLVSTSSLRSLEFPEVLEMIGALAATDVGRERLSALEPLLGEELEHRRGAVEEFVQLAESGPLVAMLEEEVGALVAELGGARPELGGRKLLRWGVVLATARAAVERIDPENQPRLGSVVRDLPDLGWLEQRIAATLDSRGEVRDDASPELARLRGRIGGLRTTAYDQLRGVLSEHADYFSEDTTPLHNGRLVLMLRAGDRNRVEGLVHGRSGSGRSLYFEPLAAVSGNNDLQEAIAEEEAERRRLLRELAEALLDAREEIEATVDALSQLDALQAAWRFGETAGGRLAELSDGDLVLRGARHPLLAAETEALRQRVFGRPGHVGGVTPLDLELVGDRTALVVTGPNAGGKTVALKTVGLMVLLTLCGLPVPVGKGSRVPMPSRLVGVVGDEQDLMQDRSTFSGRLQRLREAWDVAGPGALILLDELGSGTDPEEGSALSVALVEHLVARQTMTFVTTHLIAVASAAADTEGAECASMEFDHETNLPTFRLVLGPPGGSEAIALARQLGLPEEWLGRAEELVGEEHGKLQRLLADVERVRSDLESERQAATRLREQVAVERQAAGAEREQLREERRKLGRRMKSELDAFRLRVRERVNEEIVKTREQVKKGTGRKEATRVVAELFEEAPEFDSDEEVERGTAEEGDQVRHVDYSWSGTVEKVDGDRATVSVRGKRLQCALDRLRVVDEVEAAPPRPPRVESPGARTDVPRELNLIGRRVAEALEDLDRYLDQVLLVPYSEVRIVHGHGSGRLRDAVRRFASEHPAVTSSRRGRGNEGGDGATVLRLDS